MRLKQIKIINFGQLSNLTFDLPSEQLNLFFGQNEAGKSTTVAFIKQVMFGFYLRSNSSPFFEDYKPLAHVSPMGGSLTFEAEDGSIFELERLWAKGDKTKKGILTVTKDGEQVPEGLFFDQIKQIDGNFYADSFIFNQEMLGQVASLSQSDLLERIYYLGAADSSKLLDLRDDFAKEAGKLFKKTGKKPEVNQLLKGLNEKRDELSESQNQFAAYEKIAQEVKTKDADLKTAQEKLTKLQGKMQHLKQIQEQSQNYQRLQELESQVKVIDFNADDYRQAQALMAQINNLRDSLASLKRQLQNFEQEKDQVDAASMKKLLQSKSQLLQWQTEYQTCLQKANEIKKEEQQLLQLNPKLSAILNLSDAQIAQLQQDYAALVDDQNKTIVQPSGNTNQVWLIAGLVLAIIGVIQVVTSGMTGLIGCLLGLIIFGYGFIQQNKTKQKNAQLALKQKARTEQKQKFTNNYHLDPANLNIHDLLTARSNYLLKQDAEKGNQARQKQIKQQLDQLAMQVEQVTQRPISARFEDLLNGFNQLEEQVDQFEQKQAQFKRLRINETEQEQSLKELNLKLQAIFAKAKVQDLGAYDELYQASLTQAKLQAQIEALKNSLKNNLAELKQVDQQQIAAQKAEITTKIKQENEALAAEQQEIAQKQVELNNLADSTAVFEAKQNLANQESKFINSSKEYLANLLASKWIGRSLDLASNERFPKMLQAAREYLQLLTGGRYVDLILDKKITVVRFDGKKREVKYLSRGTAEQLYFALKLAFVGQIKDQINLPILIDDSFVNFDDQRIGYIEKLLNKISEHNQVLIFTAQQSLVDKLAVKALTFRKEAADA